MLTNSDSKIDRLLKGAGYFYIWHRICAVAALICGILLCMLCKPIYAYAAQVDTHDAVRIVIDPGHGGENLGADHNG